MTTEIVLSPDYLRALHNGILRVERASSLGEATLTAERLRALVEPALREAEAAQS